MNKENRIYADLFNRPTASNSVNINNITNYCFACWFICVTDSTGLSTGAQLFSEETLLQEKNCTGQRWD